MEKNNYRNPNQSLKLSFLIKKRTQGNFSSKIQNLF